MHSKTALKYHASVAGFFVFLSLLLLTIVDARRAFLGLDYSFSSPVISLSNFHLILAMTGIVGLSFAILLMARFEAQLLNSGWKLSTQTKLVAILLFAVLVTDLFVYRGVAALRASSKGKLTLWQLIPLDATPVYLKPLAGAINYLALVWHATMLSILLSSLFLLVLPELLKPFLNSGGLKSHVAGVALALPQPFCSCCSAPVASTIYKQGASVNSSLSFLVSSPMLNITTLMLAALLLPPTFASIRIFAGVLFAFPLTYILSLLSLKWQALENLEEKPAKTHRMLSNLLNRYCNLFTSILTRNQTVSSPFRLISLWGKTTLRIAKIMVPLLFLGSLLASALTILLPSYFENNFLGVILASAIGTLLMIPTWTEIPVAQKLIENGFLGPAAAMLVTLPAISLPCLLIFGGSMGNFKTAFLLGLTTFTFGVAMGLMFL